MPLDWLSLDDQGPRYVALYAAIREAVLGGRLEPGDRLPATRELADSLGLSRNVVVLAYRQLDAEGYIFGRVGAGSYVSEELPDVERPVRAKATRAPRKPRLSAAVQRIGEIPVPIHEPKQRFDFRYGVVPQDERSDEAWRQCLAAAARRPLPQYARAEGLTELRRVLADHLRVARGVDCEPDQIVVTSGSQQAIDLTGRILLDPGDAAVVEEPGYWGVRHAFAALGARLVAIPVDDQGIRVERLGESAADAKIVSVTPSHQFPTGAVLSLARRLALLRWARERNAYVLEDDYDSDFRYDGRPVETLHGLDDAGLTLYVGTLSKILFPALRVGFAVLPTELVEPFQRTKYVADRLGPTLLQQAVARFIDEGHLDRHIRRMRRHHERRRQAFVDACDRHFGDEMELVGTRTGVHVLGWLPRVPRRHFSRLAEEAAAADVGIYSVDRHFVRPPRSVGLIFGYARLSEKAIDEGLRRLAAIVDRLPRT